MTNPAGQAVYLSFVIGHLSLVIFLS